MKELLTGISVLLCVAAHAGQKHTAQVEGPLFDMRELLDASTLDVEVLAEWHVVKGAAPTRQKLVTIRVGQLRPGQDYRKTIQYKSKDYPTYISSPYIRLRIPRE